MKDTTNIDENYKVIETFKEKAVFQKIDVFLKAL